MGLEIATIGLLGSLASGAIGGGSAIMGGIAKSQSESYQSQVAYNNAIIAERQATAAKEAGDAQAFGNDLKTANTMGQQKVTQAANGLDVNTGSAVDVRTSTEQLGRLDTLTILHNASKAAMGADFQAANFRSEGAARQASSDNAITAGFLSAAGSVAGAASSFSDRWMGYTSRGMK